MPAGLPGYLDHSASMVLEGLQAALAGDLPDFRRTIALPLASNWLSGEKASLVTQPVCPAIVRHYMRRLALSHTRIIRSNPPLASSVPSGLQATP